MKSRYTQALEKQKKGYNCAQAVACTYCDLVGMDETALFKITEGFGTGMGCMMGTCGAISGAAVLAGLVRSSGNIDAPDSKVETCKLSKEIITSFNSKNGSTICRELKGVDTGEILRSCPGCVEDACKIVEQVLFAETFTE